MREKRLVNTDDLKLFLQFGQTVCIFSIAYERYVVDEAEWVRL